MASTVYECMFLLDSNKYARDQNGVVKSLSDIVEKCAGELLASRLWNEQKLQFPIKGHRKGTYWLTFIRLDTQRVTEFNREAQLNGAILRHLLVKHDPRLVDTLVAHARGELVHEDESAVQETTSGAAGS
ncbi:MAG: 30S ribosomal protein S6 [Planctomycetales bacterium]|nr:30S ribosomal protein S6 [Planctomycetales bacterium]